MLWLVASTLLQSTSHAAPSSFHYSVKRLGSVDQLPSRLHNCTISATLSLHMYVTKRTISLAGFVDPPKLHFSRLPESQTAMEGDTVTLDCEASGVPPSQIYWTFNGQPMEDWQGRSGDRDLERLLNLGLRTVEFGVSRAQLRLPCVSPDAAGLYACVAANGYHRIVAKAAVAILPSPASTLVTCDEDEAKRPSIYLWSDSRLERQGASAQLACRASGVPAPNITWLSSEGIPVIDGRDYQLLPNGDLLITEANWSHMDTYRCVATNEFGSDSREIFFYPTAVSFLSETDVLKT